MIDLLLIEDVDGAVLLVDVDAYYVRGGPLMMRSERCSNFWRQKKCAEFISGKAKVFWGILLFPSSILLAHWDWFFPPIPSRRISQPPRARIRSIARDNDDIGIQPLYHAPPTTDHLSAKIISLVQER